MAREDDRLAGRLGRYARVGTGVGGLAAQVAFSRLFGTDLDKGRHAGDLRRALGGLKGPLMKVAQMLATIPDALPEEYADELRELQSNAPPMGWPFVRRRMSAELGSDWRGSFAEFGREAAAAASLGQVHRARLADGREVAVKLQYPDMASAVEADLAQLGAIFAIHARMNPAIDTAEMREEIGARLREELNYELEARHIALYRHMLAKRDEIAVPEVVADLSTRRLLTMSWLEGAPLLSRKEAPLEVRNALARALFSAWWRPFSHYGAIHGDPHLGNYTAREDGGLNLLDFGCIRTFPPRFVACVVDLYRGLDEGDRERAIAAYEAWGFRNLNNELVETLDIWARFIFGPLLDDRVRTIADGVSPSQYGRREAFEVHRRLKRLGPVRPPREFVFMDRAAIGLGAVFLHLGAELNWRELFEAAIDNFSQTALAKRQKRAFKAARVALPEGSAG